MRAHDRINSDTCCRQAGGASLKRLSGIWTILLAVGFVTFMVLPTPASAHSKTWGIDFGVAGDALVGTSIETTGNHKGSRLAGTTTDPTTLTLDLTKFPSDHANIYCLTSSLQPLDGQDWTLPTGMDINKGGDLFWRFNLKFTCTVDGRDRIDAYLWIIKLTDPDGGPDADGTYFDPDTKFSLRHIAKTEKRNGKGFAQNDHAHFIFEGVLGPMHVTITEISHP